MLVQASSNGRQAGKFIGAFTSALPEAVELITEFQTWAAGVSGG